MIDFFSNWIEKIAVSVIIASIFEIILPNGNIKKYIKIVLGIFIIFNMISPFIENKKIYSINLEDKIDLKHKSNDYSTSVDNLYKNALEKEIKSSIESKGYNVKNCIVDGVFNTEKKDIGIKKITLILNSKKEKNNDEIKKIEISIGDSNKNEKDIISENEIDELIIFLSEKYEINKDIIEIRER